MSETKKCSKCGVDKELEEFHKKKTATNGLKSACKMCHINIDKEYYENNKEKVKERRKEYFKKYSEDNKENQKTYNKEYEKYNKYRRYSITSEQSDNILKNQNNSCLICKINFDDKVVPHCDHDHACCNRGGSCGKCVRVFLCINCNHGLGKFKDSPVILQEAINYLNRTNLTNKPKQDILGS